MKVVLVNPPASSSFPSKARVPPLGLAYLAGVLEKNGIVVRIDDFSINERSHDALIDEILAWKPDIVGFSAMTTNFPPAMRIAQKMKEKSNVKTCIGGSHVTFLPNESLNSGAFDFVVRGEGEYTFLDLCQNLDDVEALKNVLGLSLKLPDGTLKHNPERPLIRDLDEIPRPAYHLFDVKAYQDKAPPSNVWGGPWISYCSSRGCPFDCNYCSVTNFWGKIWRGLSPERILDDVEFLIKKYNLKSIYFVDDNFTFRKNRISEMCKKIKERKMKFEWSCSCRVDQVDEELLGEMKEAGCWRIGFGVEAGTQETIDWYGKKITLERAKESINLCRKVGISPFCFFIIGAPMETKEMMQHSIEFMKKLDPDIVGISHLTPFPGSELYNYVLENKIEIGKGWEAFAEDEPTMGGAATHDELKEMHAEAYKGFYFRPRNIINQMKFLAKDPKTFLDGAKTITSWVMGHKSKPVDEAAC